MIPHSLKLSSGSDLLLSIKEYSNSSNIYGFVCGVVGNLSKVTIQCPNNKTVKIFEGNLEIISLNGSFDKGIAHIHISFSDENCNVFGGHLEDGCLVKKGAEVLLTSFDKNIKDIGELGIKGLNKRVKIYILNNCPWSKRAVRLLNASDIIFDVEIIESDKQFEALNLISNQNTFPQIFLDDNFYGGYDRLFENYKKDSLKSLK